MCASNKVSVVRKSRSTGRKTSLSARQHASYAATANAAMERREARATAGIIKSVDLTSLEIDKGGYIGAVTYWLCRFDFLSLLNLSKNLR